MCDIFVLWCIYLSVVGIYAQRFITALYNSYINFYFRYNTSNETGETNKVSYVIVRCYFLGMLLSVRVSAQLIWSICLWLTLIVDVRAFVLNYQLIWQTCKRENRVSLRQLHEDKLKNNSATDEKIKFVCHICK